MTTLSGIHDIQENITINKWLEKSMTFNRSDRYEEHGYDGFEPYTNGDYVNKFLDKIRDIVYGNGYELEDVNSFKDDIIRFVYTYSDAKQTKQ